jgi:hypothetical protein
VSLHKAKLVSTLTELLSALREGPLPSGLAEPAKVMLGRGARVAVGQGDETTEMRVADDHPVPTLHVRALGLQHLQEAVTGICADEDIRRVTTPAHVESRVVDLVRRAYVAGDRKQALLDGVDALIDGLRTSARRWTVLVPVVNLRLDDGKDLRIGAVRFVPTREHLPAYVEDATAIARNGQGTPDEVAASEDIARMVVQNHVGQYPALAVVEVECESSLIPSLAAERVDEALAALQCFGTLWFSDASRALIGRAGELVGGSRGVAAFGVGRERLELKMERFGLTMPFHLTGERIEVLRRHRGLRHLSRVLAADPTDRKDLQAQLVQAALWIGAGPLFGRAAQQLVSYCTAVECLLIEKGVGDKAEPFSERLAWLLGKTSAARARLKAQAKKLYGTRSKVVHEGQLAVQPAEVQEMRWYAVQCVLRVAVEHRTWQTTRDIVDWVEKRKTR